MQSTQAEIGIFNFYIHYEDERQKINAVGLLKDQEAFTAVVEVISSASPLILPL